MIVLLKYWQPIAAAIVTALLAWGAHSLDVSWIEARHAKELAAQETALRAECKADKELTKEVSHGYQSKITDLNAKLAALKRVRPSRCVVPIAGDTAGRSPAAGADKPAGQDGTPAESLYDFAGDAEKYRLQLIACQEFIEKTWKAKGQ